MRGNKPKNLKGEAGAVFITDTVEHTGNFDTIVAHEEAVAALVSGNIEGGLSAVPLPVGVPFFGTISSITLASGKVMAYKAS